MTQPEVLRVGIRLAVAFEKPACRDDGASGREKESARGYRNDPPHAAARRSLCLYMTGSPGRDGGGGGGGGGMYGVAGAITPQSGGSCHVRLATKLWLR
jgi:hypothetical protein